MGQLRAFDDQVTVPLSLDNPDNSLQLISIE